MKLHAVALVGGGEYTLCGVALDAHESGDEAEPIYMATVGQQVSCEGCCRAIDYAKTFKRYRVPQETP